MAWSRDLRRQRRGLLRPHEVTSVARLAVDRDGPQRGVHARVARTRRIAARASVSHGSLALKQPRSSARVGRRLPPDLHHHAPSASKTTYDVLYLTSGNRDVSLCSVEVGVHHVLASLQAEAPPAPGGLPR